MIRNIISVVQESKVTHPIAVSASKEGRYWSDFLKLIEDYENELNEKEYQSFLDKSQLDQKIDMTQYLQFASEITVVDYVLRHYCKFVNEPQYNSKKNPECSFEYEGRTINIEVKCPNLTKRIEQEKSGKISLFAAERFPDKMTYDKSVNFIESNINDGHSVQKIDRLDNKLKDYLLSAHEKFPKSSISNFNVLVIAVDIIQDMDEWYSYLFGDNGVFSNKTYVEEDYSNVDAVMITNVQHGHMGDEIDTTINCWQLENYVSLLFLDPRKENINNLGEYYFNSGIDLFGGLTRNFLRFQYELDETNNQREKKIENQQLNENKRIELSRALYAHDKIVDLQIISEWVMTLKHQDSQNTDCRKKGESVDNES
jgi:hypothetical protein